MTQPVQISLFNMPTFNIVRDLKVAMHEAAKKCGLSRAQIIDGMNSLSEKYGVTLVKGNGNGLTLDTLEKWLNPSDRSRQVPLKVLPIFCAVTCDYTPLEVLAMPLSLKVIGQEDQNLLRWAKAYQQARKCRKTMRDLEPEIQS